MGQLSLPKRSRSVTYAKPYKPCFYFSGISQGGFLFCFSLLYFFPPFHSTSCLIFPNKPFLVAHRHFILLGQCGKDFLRKNAIVSSNTNGSISQEVKSVETIVHVFHPITSISETIQPQTGSLRNSNSRVAIQKEY